MAFTVRAEDPATREVGDLIIIDDRVTHVDVVGLLDQNSVEKADDDTDENETIERPETDDDADDNDADNEDEDANEDAEDDEKDAETEDDDTESERS